MYCKENIEQENINSIPFGKKFCECRCGELIDTKDSHGRYRRYVVGHNRRGKKMTDPIYVEIEKITSLSHAKDIIITQAKIIQDLQSKIEWMEENKEATAFPLTQGLSYSAQVSRTSLEACKEASKDEV